MGRVARRARHSNVTEANDAPQFTDVQYKNALIAYRDASVSGQSAAYQDCAHVLRVPFDELVIRTMPPKEVWRWLVEFQRMVRRILARAALFERLPDDVVASICVLATR